MKNTAQVSLLGSWLDSDRCEDDDDDDNNKKNCKRGKTPPITTKDIYYMYGKYAYNMFRSKCAIGIQYIHWNTLTVLMHYKSFEFKWDFILQLTILNWSVIMGRVAQSV